MAHLESGMPEAMRALPQWLLWKLEPVPGRNGLQKVPYYASGAKRGGNLGGAADRASLATFEAVLSRFAAAPQFSGVGFAFLEGDGLVGIDLDWKESPDGNPLPHHEHILKACVTFTETSPSGKGVHLIARGQVDSFKHDSIGVEVYCGGRYFTCTGNRWPDRPQEVQPLEPFALVYMQQLVQQAKDAARAARQAAAPAAAPAPAAMQRTVPEGQKSNDFRKVNDAAHTALAKWVPTLFPKARTWRNGYRVRSKELGRDLEEDLQLTPEGVYDFGEEAGLSPIDCVMKWLPAASAKDALHWLAPLVGVDLPARRLSLVRGRDAGRSEGAAPKPEREPVAAQKATADKAEQGQSGGGSRDGQAGDGSGEEDAEPIGDTHHDLALAWCRARSIGEFEPVYTAGAFYAPEESGLWRRMSMEEVQVDIARMFNGRKLCKKHSDYRQITDHLAAVCEKEGFFEDAPAGVVTPAGFHALSENGSVATMPLHLSHRQSFALSHQPEYEADSPLLDGVLRAAFEGADPEGQIDLWWQCVGAALFGLMPRFQVVLLMLGRERSGKSLLQRILERTFPAAAVGAVSPASWGHEYHVATLAGKRLNVVGELSDDAPIPAAAFKNVTGQNLVAGRHPTHRPFSFRCQAAHVFASNVLPPTTDRSEAFYRRWRVLRFANTVPNDKVDPDLCEKILRTEMPGFLASAFLGAERVARAGRISITTVHEDCLKKWRLNANPLEQFLADEEWVELMPGSREHTPADLYETYRRWSAANGFRNPFGRNHFLDLLESTGASKGVVVRRDGTRNKVHGVWLVPRKITD